MLALGGRQSSGRGQSRIGSLGPIVDALDAGALACLQHQPLHGLEEVHMQAGEGVDAAQLGIAAWDAKRS